MFTNDSCGKCLKKFVPFFFFSVEIISIDENLDMILCGSPNSGKSSAAILMIDILTQIQQQQQLQTSNQQRTNSSTTQDSNYTQDIAGQTHKLYR
jgi:hypothetical protein